MRKRLRKKKRLGEFKEFCFQVDLKIPTQDQEFLYKLCDDLIDFVESKDAYMGGSLDSFITYLGKQKNLSMEDKTRKTLEYKEQLVNWLLGQPRVESVQTSELKDVWHED